MKDTNELSDDWLLSQGQMNAELGDLLNHLRARFLYWYDAPYENTFGSRAKALYQNRIPAYVAIGYLKEWVKRDVPPTDEEWDSIFKT